MEQRQRYFFRKEDKLKSRKAIGFLFEKGFRFSHMPYRVFYAQAPEGLQAGIGAGSRNLKKATDRNRAKRLMREAYRLQKNELQMHLQTASKGMQVFFLFTGTELPTQHEVMHHFDKMIKKLIRLSDENFKILA